MTQELIRWAVVTSLVGLLTACGEKPGDGKPTESLPNPSGFVVPDKELGLDYYRANFAQVQPTIEWCHGNKPDKRSVAQNKNCKDASFAKMAPKKSIREGKTYEGFQGGTL